MANRILQSISLLMVILGLVGLVLNFRTNMPIAFASLTWAVWFGYMGLRSYLRRPDK